MQRKIKETYHKLGEILVRRNLAPAEAIDDALALQRSELSQRRSPPKLGQILVDRKVLDRKMIDEILEEQRIGRGEKRELKIDLRSGEGISVVVLDGRVDETKEEAITKIFERLMNRGFARIAVDCTKLIYLNSHGISSFVSYIDEARARGGDMKFFGLSADARLVMNRLGLSDFVQWFPTEEETAKAFALPIDDYMSRGALAEYVANETGRYYHLSYCSAAQKISEDEKHYYQNKSDAKDAGKAPCKRCKP